MDTYTGSHSNHIFNLLTSGSIQAEGQPWSICMPTLIHCAYYCEHGGVDLMGLKSNP